MIAFFRPRVIELASADSPKTIVKSFGVVNSGKSGIYGAYSSVGVICKLYDSIMMWYNDDGYVLFRKDVPQFSYPVFSRTGELLLIYSQWHLSVWNVNETRMLWEFNHNEHSMFGFCDAMFTPSGDRVILFYEAGDNIIVFDSLTGQIVEQQNEFGYAGEFSTDGSVFIVNTDTTVDVRESESPFTVLNSFKSSGNGQSLMTTDGRLFVFRNRMDIIDTVSRTTVFYRNNVYTNPVYNPARNSVLVIYQANVYEIDAFGEAQLLHRHEGPLKKTMYGFIAVQPQSVILL
jgi:hypothetical protein